MLNDGDFKLDFVDRCEQLAAEYGMNPMEILRWPWRRLEAFWASYQRRAARGIKMAAMAKGHDIYGVGEGSPPAANGHSRGAPIARGTPAAQGMDPASITSTLRQLEKFPEQPFSMGKPETYYMSENARAGNAPSDADDWDVPEAEVNALAMWMPGAFKVTKGRHPAE